MHLRSIRLLNYKNHEDISVEFIDGLNGLVGANGVGKTNLLESIYYGLTGIAYFHRSDKFNIRQGEEQALIHIEMSDDTEVKIGLSRSGKKVIRLNGVSQDRLADYIGTFPAVMIAPGDISLIIGTSEERRRFIDRTLSQTDKEYLEALTKYNRLLDRRNKQLKTFYDQRYWDEDLIDVMDTQIAPVADQIHDKRKKFISSFLKSFRKYYSLIEGGNENVDLKYQSDLTGEQARQVLLSNRDADRYAQRTTQGVHKDDLEFLLDENPLKKFGSQGQIKTFLISLNLAAFDHLKKHSNVIPFLLLDDIFEKIDSTRAQKLMETIHKKPFGQVFVTDTDLDRLQSSTEVFDDNRTFMTVK